MHVQTLYSVHTYKKKSNADTEKCNLCTELRNNREQKLKKFERFKRFRIKSCRSISLPVKDIASEATRGHITTGIFSTDKVRFVGHKDKVCSAIVKSESSDRKFH